jgi:DNA repair protein RadC
MSHSLTDLAKHSRPRERLARMGAEHLHSAELIALLLGSGTNRQHVMDVAQTLLRTVPLEHWKSLETDAVTQVSGIGRARSARLLAAVELGKRIFRHTPPPVVVHQPTDALDLLQDIRTKKREHIVLLLLNARGHLLKRLTVAIGSLNQVVIEPRDVYAEAVQLPCSSLLLAHNHPSGDPTPSQADIVFTHQIAAAGQVLGIEVIDHLILTEQTHLSLREAGYLDPTPLDA